MTGWWDDEIVVEPVRLLLEELAVGEELVDLDRLYARRFYVELLFRSLVMQEWRDWPPEWTTDGSVHATCVRAGEHELQVVSMVTIGFSPIGSIPLRSTFELSPARDHVTRYTADVGEVDRRTGAPILLPSRAMIIPARDEDGRLIEPELFVRRRTGPIPWTRAITWSAP